MKPTPQQPGNLPMDPQLAELVLQEHHRRTGRTPSGAKGSLRDAIRAELFDKQREYLEDLDRAIAVVCERRAGKTVGFCSKLLDVASANGSHDCIYINPTGKQAKKIMWDGQDGLKVACKRLNIRASFNNQDLILQMPNGAKIFVGGAAKKDDIEQYRGQKFKLIIIDEAGSFPPHLEDLIEDVLQPTLMDLGGTIVLGGTPPKILAGVFYEAIRPDAERNQAYTLHRWSIHDNPHIKDPAAFHEWVLATNKWTREHPKFRREYLGEVVREDETLVYRNYLRERNGYTLGQLPSVGGWMHILGVDLGYEDDTAFRVVSFSPQHPKAFLNRCYKAPHLSVTKVAQTIMAWDSEFGFISIVVDFGGGGKQIVAEMNERWSLNLQPADKANKASFIETLNDDLLGGGLMVPYDDPVLEEWEKLQWNEIERLRSGERVTVRIEDPRISNHISDATLYAYRESKHFAFSEPEHVPRRGDDDFSDYEAQEMLRLAEGQYARDQGQEWFAEGYNPEGGLL